MRTLAPLLAILLLIATPTDAQDKPIVYEWPDYGLAFAYPADLTYRDVDNLSGSVLLSQLANPNYGDDMLFVFSAPWVMALYPPDADFFSPELALRSFFIEFGLETEMALGTMMGNDTVEILEYANDAGESAYLVLDNAPELNLLALVFATNSEQADIALAIAESIRPLAEAAPCTVQTEATNVRVRVGPGLNRGVFIYLPANLSVTVTGQAEANDGMLWYQLAKAEAAPDSAANEIWVASTVVATSGACDIVPAVEPPPIIPFDAADTG